MHQERVTAKQNFSTETRRRGENRERKNLTADERWWGWFFENQKPAASG